MLPSSHTTLPVSGLSSQGYFTTQCLVLHAMTPCQTAVAVYVQASLAVKTNVGSPA